MTRAKAPSRLDIKLPVDEALPMPVFFEGECLTVSRIPSRTRLGEDLRDHAAALRAREPMLSSLMVECQLAMIQA